MFPHMDELITLCAQVRLPMAVEQGAICLGEGKDLVKVGAIPTADWDDNAHQGELIAIAAGLDAALSFPCQVEPGETFLQGAANLLAKIERRRFVDAYNTVVLATGAGDDARILYRELGADLVVTFVEDEGWRFRYLVQGHQRTWNASLDSIYSGARSNLYAREAPDPHMETHHIKDGYDAARAILMEDVYFARISATGIPMAVPDRDHLLVGSAAHADAVKQAYLAADYPLSPYPLAFKRGRVERLG
jgi:hypothetical protein